MTISTFIGNTSGKECITVLFYVCILTGLFFTQKYIYLLERKFAEYSKITLQKARKPWPLYVGIALGLLSFLYSVFTKKDRPSFIDFNNIWHIMLLVTIMVCVIVILYESITCFGIKTGILRSILYIVLMILSFYAGFITGLFLVTFIAIGVLIYFFRYFKNLFT